MTIDMTQNRAPYGLLTAEEKAALYKHEKDGGEFLIFCNDAKWRKISPAWNESTIYRTVPLPLTQDEIAWERLPDWAEWVARDEGGVVYIYDDEPDEGNGMWVESGIRYRRIDDFPGIILKRGTCDWKDSKQRRPQK